MTSRESGRIQFINLSFPGDAISAKEQRRVHSHAARTAHANARRILTIEYQSGKAKQIPENAQGVKEQSITLKSRARPALGETEIEQAGLPSPVSLLASDRRDPFQSFARSFKPVEHFLLDHCRFPTTSIVWGPNVPNQPGLRRLTNQA